MSILINEDYANPSTPLWTSVLASGVASVSNADSTIIVSPTTGNVLVKANYVANTGSGLTVSGNTLASLGAQYISLTSSASQSVAVTNVAKAVQYDTVGAVNGTNITWAVGNNSRINILASGTYRFCFSAQIVASASNKHMYMYLRKNGTTAIPLTNSILSTSNNLDNCLTVELVVACTSGEYYELMFLSPDDSAMMLEYIAGSGSGSTQIPATPSIIMNVYRLI